MAIIRIAPTGADADSRFTWNTPEGAILHLPRGASRLNCFSDLFRSHAITHGISWYKFANNKLHRRLPNGSLYLITGTDKTNSWMVGAFSGVPSGDQVSLHLSVAGSVEGSNSFTYSWATSCAPAQRTGPRKDGADRLSQEDLDAIGRDDAVFQGDAPDGRDQCAFLRGYRIMLNRDVTDSGEVRLDTNALPIKDASPEDVSATTNYVPFAGSSKWNSPGGRSAGGGSGGGQRRIGAIEGPEKKSFDSQRDHGVLLESIPEHSEVCVSDSVILDWTKPYSISQAIPSVINHQQISFGISQYHLPFVCGDLIVIFF
jgi:hypothetical protein